MEAATITNDAYGPFRPGVDQTERIAQLRALAALVGCFVGTDSLLIRLLRKAETDDEQLMTAMRAIDRLPAGPRRKILANFLGIHAKT